MARRGAERQGHGVVAGRVRGEAVDQQQHDAADDQRDADQPGALEQHLLDEVVQQEADDHGREEGEQDAEHEAPGARVGRQADQHQFHRRRK